MRTLLVFVVLLSVLGCSQSPPEHWIAWTAGGYTAPDSSSGGQWLLVEDLQPFPNQRACQEKCREFVKKFALHYKEKGATEIKFADDGLSFTATGVPQKLEDVVYWDKYKCWPVGVDPRSK